MIKAIRSRWFVVPVTVVVGIAMSVVAPSGAGLLPHAAASGVLNADANTLLLDHFDGTTTGTPEGPLTYAPSQPGMGSAGVFGPGVFDILGPISSSSDSGTIEMWLDPTSYPATNIGLAVFNWYYTLTQPWSGYVLQMGITSPSTVPPSHPYGSTAVGSDSIPTGQWTHLALTWSPTSTDLYVNGVLSGSGAGGSPGPTPYYVYLNYWGDSPTGPYTGLIDELRISDVARSASEIASDATVTVPVTVSGSQTFGSTSPTLDVSATPPAGISVTGTVSCTSVSGSPDQSIAAALPAGSYTIDPATCTGLSLTGAGSEGLTVQYVGGAFTVIPAATTLFYSGGNFVALGNSLPLSATLSSSASACTSAQPVQFSLDRDPTTGTPGSYPIASGTTNSAGSTPTLTAATSGWQDGVYTVTASYAGTDNCLPSSDSQTVTVASPSDAASGGGWYTNSGRANFGFTVHLVPHTANTYTGQLLFVQNGKWRLKGTLANYGKSAGVGKASGTGSLYWMTSSGAWQLAQSGVQFTITFAATTGKTAGQFGISIAYKPVSPQPAALPAVGPTTLKGGHITVK